MGGKEKKFLVAFIILCILLPFGMVRSPIELFSHIIPLWVYYYPAIGWWYYTEKPLWQTFLASYGITSLGIIGVYFGTGISQIAISLLKKRFFKTKKEVPKKKKGNSRSMRSAKWLGRGGIGLILFVLLFPFPLSDPIATMAMKLKGVRYGLWYLLAVNVLHIYLIVWGVYQGKEWIEFFFKWIKLFFF